MSDIHEQICELYSITDRLGALEILADHAIGISNSEAIMVNNAITLLIKDIRNLLLDTTKDIESITSNCLPVN